MSFRVRTALLLGWWQSGGCGGGRHWGTKDPHLVPVLPLQAPLLPPWLLEVPGADQAHFSLRAWQQLLPCPHALPSDTCLPDALISVESLLESHLLNKAFMTTRFKISIPYFSLPVLTLCIPNPPLSCSLSFIFSY